MPRGIEARIGDRLNLNIDIDAPVTIESVQPRLEERLEHIWSSTHDEYRGYAGERWPASMRGRRTVLVYAGRHGTVLKLLDELSDAEIAAKLPVQLRHLPQTIAA